MRTRVKQAKIAEKVRQRKKLFRRSGVIHRRLPQDWCNIHPTQPNILFTGRMLVRISHLAIHLQHANKLKANQREERTKNQRQEIINILLDIFNV